MSTSFVSSWHFFQHNVLCYFYFFCLACGILPWAYYLYKALYLAVDSRHFGHCSLYIEPSSSVLCYIHSFFFLVVLGIDLGASCILGKSSTSKDSPQPMLRKF